MSTSARRQREFAQREELFLEHARVLLRRHGYLGLNLDDLAAAAEYSKGTIYQHFETKEDLILAIAAGSLEMRVQFFERAEHFDGLSRERILAVGVADDIITELFPEHFQISQMVKTPSIWEKTSAKRRERLALFEGKCFSTVERVVTGGIAAGDLPLEKSRAGEVAFGMMTMALGTHLVTSSAEWLKQVGIRNPRTVLRSGQHRILDGWEWRPCSKDWDYQKTERRIRAELFAEECRVLAGKK